jgi:pimeloyl-ACP methyl ester carboxylesterase
VAVSREAGVWHFLPRQRQASAVALVFFPGALVDPRAYAPLVRAVALQGFPGYLIELPRRGALGGADDPGVRARLDVVLRDQPDSSVFVVAGHSRGGVVASAIASHPPPRFAGLILIGTSHPRDVDLRSLTVPAAKIVGTRDGLASLAEVRANADRLPSHTRWTWVEGGNHSQFGWYGFQPGDRWPAVDAAVQRRAMIDAVLELLRLIASTTNPDG